jgi:hypothetical protein
VDNITNAKNHARMLGSEGLSGYSGRLRDIGNIATDPQPNKLLAVGVAHAGEAILALIAEVEDLRKEVARLRGR